MNVLTKMMIVVLFMTLSLSADMWSVEGAVGQWRVDSKGTITQTTSNDVAGDLIIQDQLSQNESNDQLYLYMVLKHPIVVIPNFRVEYVDVRSQGKNATVALQTSFGGSSTSSSNVESELSLTQYDLILFYNLIDKSMWTTVDLGIDLKYIDSRYQIKSYGVDEQSSSVTPLLYLRGRVDIPVVDIGVEADGKYITDGTSVVYDARVKVDYTMEFVPVLQPRVELGYRMQKFKVDGENSNLLGNIFSNKSDVDMEFRGLYVGVGVVF